MLGFCLVLILTLFTHTLAFVPSQSVVRNGRSLQVKMEYIPEGLTKAQWQAIKKKEEEDKKAKGNLGAMGTKRFRSRSFEAWQKSGGQHLFPVNPTEVPYEERPYMQRRGGDWEGKDLEGKGLQGTGQGKAYNKLKLDDVYEKAKAEGKMDSISIFGGMPLPWTNEAVSKISNNGPTTPKKGEKATAGKKLSEEEMKRLKATLFKPVTKNGNGPNNNSKVAAAAPTAEAEKKKGFFGLF